jgi:hypothetical protein
MENGYQDTSVAFRSILASCFVNGNTDWLCLGYTDVVFTWKESGMDQLMLLLEVCYLTFGWGFLWRCTIGGEE